MSEYIYQMVKAREKVGNRLILDGITTALLPGTKIGMAGPNSADKSTILKIVVGLDEPNSDEAVPNPGSSVGILLREPPLNEDKDVLSNVEESVGEIEAKLDRLNEILTLMSKPDADFDALMERVGKFQEEIDAANAWDFDNRLEQVMDALRCPPPDAEVRSFSGGG